MITFDYKKINSAEEYEASEFNKKSADKALFPLVEPLQDCTEKEGVELYFINIDNVPVPIWKAYDMDYEGYEWWVMTSKDGKNIATLSDFNKEDLINRSKFVSKCKKLKAIMTRYKDAVHTAKKSSGELDLLGFDPAKADQIWRKQVYDKKKLKPNEIKLLTTACHKLVDMMAQKDPGHLGLYVFAKLADYLDIPTK